MATILPCVGRCRGGYQGARDRRRAARGRRPPPPCSDPCRGRAGDRLGNSRRHWPRPLITGMARRSASSTQRRERLGVAPGGLSDDHRALGVAHELGNLVDVLLARLHGRRRRHLARARGRRPVVQHVLERHVEIDRSLRHALRHFAGADHALVERIRAGHGARPLGDRLDEALDAADGEAAIPLLFDIEVGIFAEASAIRPT